ncbi:putative lipoprotein, partial [hydrothermal vent metagenome]
MKKIKIAVIPLLLVLFLSSCTSVRVLSDYDKEADFGSYKSYAFYKTGIDKAQISDLDKKRILRAIETEMGVRGFVKSENPDVLVSIFTKESEQVDVFINNWGGLGWGGLGWGGMGWGGMGWGG